MDDFSLSEYKNRHTEIIILCKKHNIKYKALPASYLSNIVSCKKCRPAQGYNKADKQSGRFYIYKTGKYLKFGITNSTVAKRAKDSVGKDNFEIILDYHYVDAEIPLKIETAIKRSKAITNQAKIDGILFNGFTETMKNTQKNLKFLFEFIRLKEKKLGIVN